MKSKTFLIKSTKNRSFGTAFCVAKDEHGSFLVTCNHVVEACEIDFLEVESKKAKLQCQGSSTEIDLAVVYVEGLTNTKTIPLSLEMTTIGTAFSIDGFKPHKKESHLQRTLQGSIAKISKIHTTKEVIETYELSIENSFSIEQGYSGSALLSNGQVIGVATDRNSNGKQAYAIPMRYLKEIWEDMPKNLFKPRAKKREIKLASLVTKYLLESVIGVIVLGLLVNYLYDKMKPSLTKDTFSKSVLVKENNTTASVVELHNEGNDSTKSKKIEFTQNSSNNSTIKVFQ